jgi:hypothetical protein
VINFVIFLLERKKGRMKERKINEQKSMYNQQFGINSLTQIEMKEIRLGQTLIEKKLIRKF